MPELHVVTGASGHVAANLIPALVAGGHRVRAVSIEPLSRPIPALAALGIERVQADVTDGHSLLDAFDGADVVHHLAARITVRAIPDRRVREVNVGGVKNVVAACRDRRVRRLVHVSSIHAGSRGLVIPQYDRSKSAGERVVLDAVADGLDAVVLRPTGIIGPRDHAPSRMGKFFLDLYRGRLPALVDGGFNWVDVRDVATAATRAAARGQVGRTYTVSGYWRSLRALAETAGAVTGVRPPRFSMPYRAARFAAWGGLASQRFSPASMRALRDHEAVACDYAVTELGHWPRPPDDTIAAIYESFDKLGLLQRGRTTPSTAGGNTTVTRSPMAIVAESTESSAASAEATTLPTTRIN